MGFSVHQQTFHWGGPSCSFSAVLTNLGNSSTGGAVLSFCSIRLTCPPFFYRCITSIPSFLPLQLGICCAHQRDDVWELRVHEFNLWPSKRLFVSDFKSLQFLREHGCWDPILEADFSFVGCDTCTYRTMIETTWLRELMRMTI